jgi:DNA repair ATPase RecN
MDKTKAARTRDNDAQLQKLLEHLEHIYPPIAELLRKQEDEVIEHARDQEHLEEICDRLADANNALAGLEFSDRRLIISILTETTDTLEKIGGVPGL